MLLYGEERRGVAARRPLGLARPQKHEEGTMATHRDEVSPPYSMRQHFISENGLRSSRICLRCGPPQMASLRRLAGRPGAGRRCHRCHSERSLRSEEPRLCLASARRKVKTRSRPADRLPEDSARDDNGWLAVRRGARGHASPRKPASGAAASSAAPRLYACRCAARRIGRLYWACQIRYGSMRRQARSISRRSSSSRGRASVRMRLLRSTPRRTMISLA
jgi:hypothetical protein